MELVEWSGVQLSEGLGPHVFESSSNITAIVCTEGFKGSTRGPILPRAYFIFGIFFQFHDWIIISRIFRDIYIPVLCVWIYFCAFFLLCYKLWTVGLICIILYRFIFVFYLFILFCVLFYVVGFELSSYLNSKSQPKKFFCFIFTLYMYV